MIRILLTILLGLVVGIWEAALRPVVPPIISIPLLLPAVILMVVTSKSSRAILMTMTAVTFIGLYQVFYFDLIVLRWVAIVLIVISLSRYWLTNRSVYSSVALGVIARVLDWGSLYAVSHIGLFLTNYSRGWGIPSGWYLTLGYDAILIALGFFLISSITNRFQPSVQRENAKKYHMI